MTAESAKQARLLRYLRIAIQSFVLIVFILSPLLQIVRTFRQVPYPYAESPIVAYEPVSSTLARMDRTLEQELSLVYDEISGGPFTLDVLGLRLVEPLTGFAYLFANLFRADAWTLYTIIAVLLPLLLAVFLGRIYCGYVCPVSLITKLNQSLQKKWFNRTSNIRGSHRYFSKYTVFFNYSVIVFLLLVSPSLMHYFLPPALLQNGYSDYVLFGSFSIWLGLLLVVLGIEVARPGLFCRVLCPTGNFLVFISRKRMATIGYQPKHRCLEGCHLCNEACWLGLNPKTKADDPACDLCQSCTVVCPTQRLITKQVEVNATPVLEGGKHE